MTMLSRDDILRGLHRIDELAREASVVIDLSIYGGAALALVFELRITTKDVDAVVRGNPGLLREFAKVVADEQGWPADWLNDGVKGFTSTSEDMNPLPDFSDQEGLTGGLRIFTPSPQYLFAMKCMAMRAEGLEGSHDVSDIEALADLAEIKDVEDALNLVESFYPKERISPKTKFGVEEIMERVAQRRAARCGAPIPSH